MLEVPLTVPRFIRPGYITEPTRYVVNEGWAAGNHQYAVMIEGGHDWPGFANRSDGVFPPIEVQCSGRAQGVLIRRLDTASMSRVFVADAVGCAIDVDGCRQSELGELIVHRARPLEELPTTPAVRVWSSGKDSSNMLGIDKIEVLHCGSECYLEILGNSRENQSRLITIDRLWLHTPWKNAQDQWPMQFPEKRTLVRMRHVRDSFAIACNLRMDGIAPHEVESIAVDLQDCQRVEIGAIGGQCMDANGLVKREHIGRYVRAKNAKECEVLGVAVGGSN